MSGSTSTRVALSHKHENRNANGKIFFVHVQEGRTNNIETENKKRKTKDDWLLAKVKFYSGQLKSAFSI